MTPECPKGPEREARPEGSSGAPSGYTCVFTHAPGVVLCDFCKPVEPSPLVHNVILSSEEGAFGHWNVTCSCRESSEGDLAHAEFWKDQHLADTLTNESFISPQQAADELSRETQEVFEGRPSGSTAAAPQVVEINAVNYAFAKPDGPAYRKLVDWFEEPLNRTDAVSAADTAASVVLWFLRHRDMRFMQQQDAPHAASAAGSEATPKGSCKCGHTSEYHGPDVPGCVECSCRKFRPSPSLRKEGEDN